MKIFSSRSGTSCARLVYNITPTGADVKGGGHAVHWNSAVGGAETLDLRAFSSGVRFFLAICNTSNVVLLFYAISEVYTNFGMVSVMLGSMSQCSDRVPPNRFKAGS